MLWLFCSALVYADQLFGSKLHGGSSYYIAPREKGRADKASSWRKKTVGPSEQGADVNANMGVAWKDLSWGQKKQIRQENRSTEIEGENRKRMGVPASMATNYLVVTASMATNDLVVYLCKMFRHFLAH